MADGVRCCGLLASALVATVIAAAPAVADDYLDAFDLRVSDTGSRSALDSFVVQAVRQGQYDQALSTLEEVILRNPADIGARLAMARIYYQISSYDLAAAHIEQAMLTAGWEAFRKEIEELKARIDRAKAGWEYIFSVSGGVDYQRISQTVYDFVPADYNASATVPFAEINGVVIRDLQTASGDEIRIGGVIRYLRSLGDTNFDNTYTVADQYKGQAYITYSKGLPDIIDTLRVDVTAHAQFDHLSSARKINDYGAQLQVSVQPSVESQLRAFVGYSWLGSSVDYYTTHRLSYGVSGEYRLAPGVALGAYAKGFHDWGVSPEPNDFYWTGTDYVYLGYDFQSEGYEVGASVSHLLWVFEDGRSWVQEAGVRYGWANVLDYASLYDFFDYYYSMVDRRTWEVFWNHSVQVHKNTVLDFGAYYGQAKYTNSDVSFDRTMDYWGLKAGLTFQFN